MLGCVERPEKLRHLLETFELRRLGAEPDGLRLECRLGHEHRDDIERRAVAYRLPRVGDDLLGDGHAPEVELDTEPLGCLDRLFDRRLRLLLHLRVPVDARGADDRHAILERQCFDEVLLAEMQVDRAFVDGRVRAVALDEPEQRSCLALDDGECLCVARAQRYAGGGVVAALPDVAGRRVLQLGEQRRAPDGLGPEGL